MNAFDFKFGSKISLRGPETVRKTHSSTSSSSTSSTSSSSSSRGKSSGSGGAVAAGVVVVLRVVASLVMRVKIHAWMVRFQIWEQNKLVRSGNGPENSQ